MSIQLSLGAKYSRNGFGEPARQSHVLRQLVMRPEGERDSVQIEKDPVCP